MQEAVISNVKTAGWKWGGGGGGGGGGLPCKMAHPGVLAGWGGVCVCVCVC